MSKLNYNHLYYFYAVAKDGSISKASDRLHLTPQTISGQISSFETQIGSELFERKGKRLYLSEMGRLIYEYAEEIFQLGDELKNVLKTQQHSTWQKFHVGITDVIPKILTCQLLKPVLAMTGPIKLICHEGEQESLLADLAIDKLDMIISDQPLPPNSQVKAYNHHLTDSGFTFFSPPSLAKLCKKNFPASLSGQPFLLQGKRSVIRQSLLTWFEQHNIVPQIVAEFDDSAMLKSFAQAGYGIFIGPTIIEKNIVSQYNVIAIGSTETIKDNYYAISPERRLKHPAVLEIFNALDNSSN